MDDLVVAMRSGPPANHEHGDRNSVILKYFGEILLTDSKRPTYNAKSPAWMLRTSPGHNTILIDGEGHQYHSGLEGTNESKASAEIVRKGQRPGYEFWASDATQAYAILDADVESVTRTVLVFGDMPFLLVLDKIRKKEVSSDFAARWFIENSDGEADIETDGQTFTLSRPKAKFFGVVAGNQELEVVKAKLPLDESFGVFPHVDVKSSGKSRDAFMILAGSPLQNCEESPEVEIRKKGDAYEIEVSKGDQYLKLKVYDQEDLPEWEVVEQK